MKRIAMWSPLFLVAALLLGGVGCAGTYVAAGYDYDYYPNTEVYYSPGGHQYYWRDHDTWQHGASLPRDYHVENDHPVRVHLNTDKPYTMHAQVSAAHPHADVEEHH